MLKLFGVCVALGVIAVVVWFGMVALSPSYNDCVSKNGQHPTENYTSDGQQIIDGPIDNPTVARLALRCGSIFANRNGEAFTGLFTIVLTFATGFLGYMAWKQDEMARVQNRAYVYFWDVLPAQTNTTPPITLTDVFSVIFMNLGKTPAIVTSYRIDCEPHNSPPLPAIAKEQVMPSGAVIGSNQPWFRGQLDFGAATAQERNTLYLYGEIRYRDILGKNQRSWFCRRYNGRQFVLSDDLAGIEYNGNT